MMASPHFGRLVRVPVSLLMIACLGQFSLADEDDQTPADNGTEVEDTEEAAVVEEIVVIANRPGNPVDVDEKYGELLRRRIIRDVARLNVLKEEFKWRSSDTNTANDESRIRWGYDPRDHNRVRQDTPMTDLPIDDTKPATIFSVEF